MAQSTGKFTLRDVAMKRGICGESRARSTVRSTVEGEAAATESEKAAAAAKAAARRQRGFARERPQQRAGTAPLEWLGDRPNGRGAGAKQERAVAERERVGSSDLTPSQSATPAVPSASDLLDIMKQSDARLEVYARIAAARLLPTERAAPTDLGAEVDTRPTERAAPTDLGAEVDTRPARYVAAITIVRGGDGTRAEAKEPVRRMDAGAGGDGTRAGVNAAGMTRGRSEAAWMTRGRTETRAVDQRTWPNNLTVDPAPARSTEYGRDEYGRGRGIIPPGMPSMNLPWTPWPSGMYLPHGGRAMRRS